MKMAILKNPGLCHDDGDVGCAVAWYSDLPTVTRHIMNWLQEVLPPLMHHGSLLFAKRAGSLSPSHCPKWAFSGRHEAVEWMGWADFGLQKRGAGGGGQWQ